MAEHHRDRQITTTHHQQHPTDMLRGILPEKGPSKTQVAAVATLLPIGGSLLLISGLTLAGTLLGLAVTLPLFVIFSPVLVPAAIVIGLVITGFLTSGAFGITALSALSWMANFFRRMRVPETQLEQAKRGAQDTAGYVGQKVKETGQAIQSKAHEGGKEGERASK